MLETLLKKRNQNDRDSFIMPKINYSKLKLPFMAKQALSFSSTIYNFLMMDKEYYEQTFGKEKVENGIAFLKELKDSME